MDREIIKFDHIYKSYGHTNVISDMNICIEAGHIHCIIGRSGAGKTTAIKLIAGLERPDSGKISYFGEENSVMKARRRMGFMIDDMISDPEMTIHDYLEYLQYTTGYPDRKRIDAVVETMKLQDYLHKKNGSVSLDVRKRLGIASAIFTQPEVLVLDEPMYGMSSESVTKITKQLKKLVDEMSTTLLITSNSLTDVISLGTDFTFVDKGEVAGTFSSEEVYQKCKDNLCVVTDDNNKASILLEELGITRYKITYNNEINIYDYSGKIDIISKTLTDHGLIIRKLVENINLYEGFIDYLGDKYDKYDKG
ncbi:MAG: ABC transporter ATP-binding protein [Ruminococcus sp.]|nr:ABC transporter ATP-binding protein [Ruminococcus sp.]